MPRSSGLCGCVRQLGTNVDDTPGAVAIRAVDRERVELRVDRGSQPLVALTHRPLDPHALGHLAPGLCESGGGSLITSQNSPSALTASEKASNSTGLTT
jgi:hypothetical protein